MFWARIIFLSENLKEVSKKSLQLFGATYAIICLFGWNENMLTNQLYLEKLSDQDIF